MSRKFSSGLLKFFAAAVLFLVLVPASHAQSVEDYVHKGDSLYDRRSEVSTDDWADPAIIEEALDNYYKALDMGDTSIDLVERIMRANYFYGTYAEKDKKAQREIFEKSIKLGREALKRNPDSVAINYQMGGAWGRWGEVYGIVASARKGVAAEVRTYGEKAAALDPNFAEGGAYRTLGRLHFKAPWIPVVLSWPSKDESLKFLSRAVAVGPDNLTNHLFYAETLLDRGSYVEAKKHLDIVINAAVDPDNKVEDLRDKKEAADVMERVKKKL